MKDTTPVFILGSGRSGTLQMVKLLETVPGIEAHHEYLFENILKPAVLHRMGVLDKAGIVQLLRETHVPAVHYTQARVWLDSSNALPWIVGPLYELFPNAKFIHLLRDGRKVVSSFYHKFQGVMYDDRCVEILRAWLADPAAHLAPSPEKKYWRPLPMPGDADYEAGQGYSRFQLLCRYWSDCNLRIEESLAAVPAAQRLTTRLEDVVAQPADLERFLAIFDVEYQEAHLQSLKRPVNVAIPKNFPLSDQERADFEAIAGTAMRHFGYDAQEEYSVVY